MHRVRSTPSWKSLQSAKMSERALDGGVRTAFHHLATAVQLLWLLWPLWVQLLCSSSQTCAVSLLRQFCSNHVSELGLFETFGTLLWNFLESAFVSTFVSEFVSISSNQVWSGAWKNIQSQGWCNHCHLSMETRKSPSPVSLNNNFPVLNMYYKAGGFHLHMLIVVVYCCHCHWHCLASSSQSSELIPSLSESILSICT